MQKPLGKWFGFIAIGLSWYGAAAPGVLAQNLRLSSETARVGREAVFMLSIAGAPRAVSVMGFEVTFNPDVLQFAGFNPETDIPEGSLVRGWTAFGVGEPDPAAGRLRIGGFTENCNPNDSDPQIAQACSTLPTELQAGEAQPILQQGANEGGVIALLRFNVLTAGDIAVAVDPSEERLFDDIGVIRNEQGDVVAEAFETGGGRYVELSLDVDGNGTEDAGTDGLLLARFLLEAPDEALINRSVARNCTRCTAGEIRNFLTRALLDVDGNGNADAGTDGLLLRRFLLEAPGNTLTERAVDTRRCRRCSADEIRALLAR